ncbi:MAG TPA: hypothetical protein VE844_05115, partial [Gammaproteobacteria bacterium]|nr:hypothetical protein [Gammaproteobacteria bacterium]
MRYISHALLKSSNFNVLNINEFRLLTYNKAPFVKCPDVLSLMALIDDPGELLPHLPALRPPRLLDLAAGVLMGLMNTLHIQDELVTPHN